MGLYGFVFYVPSLVKSFSTSSTVVVGFLSAIPFLVGAICMVIIGSIADRTGKRRNTVATSAIIAATGLCGIAASHQLIWAMITLCIAAIGIFGTLGPFWALPTRYLRGTAAAAGIAVINSTGALAGYVAPKAMASSHAATGNYVGGLLTIAAALTLGAILVLCVPRTIDR
jgi:ACS family tartrate transporter-like MFS transporter